MSWQRVVPAIRVRVALLRVGDISEDEWARYVRLLEVHAEIDTAELKGPDGTSITFSLV